MKKVIGVIMAVMVAGTLLACAQSAAPKQTPAPTPALTQMPSPTEEETTGPSSSAVGQEKEIKDTVAEYWKCFDKSPIDIPKVQSLVSRELWEELGETLVLSGFMAKSMDDQLTIGDTMNYKLALGECEIHGDVATVSITVSQHEESLTSGLKLIKEEGRWKVPEELAMPKTNIGDTLMVDYGNRRWAFTVKEIFLIRYVGVIPVAYKDKPIPHEGKPYEGMSIEQIGQLYFKEKKHYRIGVEVTTEAIGRLSNPGDWQLRMAQIDEYGEHFWIKADVGNPDALREGRSNWNQHGGAKHKEVTTCLYSWRFYDWIDSFALEFRLKGETYPMIGPFEWHSLPGYVEGWP